LQTKDQQDEYKQYRRTFQKLALEAEEMYYMEMFDTRTTSVEEL